MRVEQKSGAERHVFAPEILREYDIRGTVGENLSAQDAFFLGRAFAAFVRRESGKANPTICTGFDGRLSSPALSDALIQGLVQSGAQVEVVGLGPSPMLYFAVKDRMADAGVMVTGSHNPPGDNGFKMLLQNRSVYGAAIQDIGRLAASGTIEESPGQSHAIEVQDTYVQRLLRDFTGKRPLKIAWDPGNGAACGILKRLAQYLPGTHVFLNDAIDGTFPGHPPDPTVDANLAGLIDAVKNNACDLGIAFDGDGDRIGVIDETGAVLRCDILMTIYAGEILKTHPGAPIIGDVKCSKVMFDEIARLGGRPVMAKTGHSLIKAKMAELRAPLAGELSGHIFFADKYYGYDDGLYCAVRLLNILSASSLPLSAMTAGLPRLYSTPELRFAAPDAEKFRLIARIAANVQAGAGPHTRIETIDGVRVTNQDGWWLLRASNTQGALTGRAEGISPAALARLEDTLRRAVSTLKET